jgi:hypothetical protein
VHASACGKREILLLMASAGVSACHRCSAAGAGRKRRIATPRSTQPEQRLASALHSASPGMVAAGVALASGQQWRIIKPVTTSPEAKLVAVAAFARRHVQWRRAVYWEDQRLARRGRVARIPAHESRGVTPGTVASL